MSDQAPRDATIHFVAELCEHVGPFTFAGHGGRIATLRHRIHQASSDEAQVAESRRSHASQRA